MELIPKSAPRLKLKPTVGNIGNLALPLLSNTKLPVMISPLSVFGRPVPWGFYPSKITVAKLSGLLPTLKLKPYRNLPQKPFLNDYKPTLGDF
jgi:hypothetical protein